MFIDQAKIFVKAGDGGNGCKSFYRDKYTRQGIPNGGDGGKGADIVIIADRNLFTLLDYKYQRHFSGRHGAHGSGKNKRGRDTPPVIIRVPIGTRIIDNSTACVLRDLEQDEQQVVVAKGGRGGIGNQHHKEATQGERGQEKELLLDLRLIADAGLVGFPNAGKSTLVSNISNAHPKIAAYPFTTKSPCLGVVKGKAKDFIIADIPGLIEGSSEGRGLGDKFLRHLERTRVLVHLVDMSGFEGRDPLEDYMVIKRELENYSQQLAKKIQVIAANKMDLTQAEENLKRFKSSVKKKVFPISALKNEGLDELIEAICKKL